MNPELHDAANSVIAWAEEVKQQKLQELAEQHRIYPSGFEFYYPSTSGELERSQILGAFLGDFAIDNIQVWYRCNVPSWTPEADEIMPLSESAIARAIERYGVPS